MKLAACFLSLALTCSSVVAASLSPAMSALCNRASHTAFVPIKAARPSADPLFQLLAETDDRALLEKRLADQKLDLLRTPSQLPLITFAAAAGNTTGLAVLIELGARVNQPDAKGYPPILHALTNGQPGAACLLIKHGAELPRADTAAYLLPAIATAEDYDGASVIVEFLISRGFDVNTRINGDTALHIAAELGNTKLIEILLRHKADATLRNQRNETPLAVARRVQQSEAVRLLKKVR